LRDQFPLLGLEIVSTGDEPNLCFHPSVLRDLGEALKAVADKLITSAMQKTSAMQGTSTPYVLRDLREALKAVADKLSPEGAAEAAKLITSATTQTTPNPSALQSLGDALRAVVDKLSPEGAAVTAKLITSAMQKASNPYTLQSLAEDLEAVTNRIDNSGLIDVLKPPFCIGRARMLLLEKLGSRVGSKQQWNGLWEMVRWVEEHRDSHPDLYMQLRTPATRP
jgi:uncharacterized protein YidB (DUF937 family)